MTPVKANSGRMSPWTFWFWLLVLLHAIGLGACDIKGAAAGLIVAAPRTTGDAAFLFSTDEEAIAALEAAGFELGKFRFSA